MSSLGEGKTAGKVVTLVSWPPLNPSCLLSQSLPLRRRCLPYMGSANCNTLQSRIFFKEPPRKTQVVYHRFLVFNASMLCTVHPSPWLRLDHYQSKLQRWQAIGAWMNSWIDATDIECRVQFSFLWSVQWYWHGHWELCWYSAKVNNSLPSLWHCMMNDVARYLILARCQQTAGWLFCAGAWFPTSMCRSATIDVDGLDCRVDRLHGLTGPTSTTIEFESWKCASDSSKRFCWTCAQRDDIEMARHLMKTQD